MRRSLLLVGGLALAGAGVFAFRSGAPAGGAPYPFALHSGDLEREIAFLSQRLDEVPERPLERASLAGAFLRRARQTGDPRDYARAEDEARRSLEDLPHPNPEARLVLARLAQARHEFAEATRLAEAVLSQQPGDAAATGLLVEAHLATGALDEAERLSAALVKRLPSTGPFLLRGLVLEAGGEDQAAQRAFAAALRAEQPGEVELSAHLRLFLARLHLRRGRLETAEALAREAQRLLPRDPLALGLRARLALRRGDRRRGDRRRAERLAHEAWQVSGDPAARIELAAACARAGEGPQAEHLWAGAERALRQELRRGRTGHRGLLARVLLDRGRRLDAEEALKLAREEAAIRQDARTRLTLARALALTDQAAAAREELAAALPATCPEPTLWSEAAALAQELRAQELARTCLRRALALDPGFPPARALRRSSGSG